jgi:hypothetical protein
MRFLALRRMLAATLLTSAAGCGDADEPFGGTGRLAAALTGGAILDELSAFRVRVFDSAEQPCVGHAVPAPGRPPLVASPLVLPAAPDVTLRVPAGPRTIYIEAYLDTAGTTLLGTGCTQVTLAAGERRAVTVELVETATDADADADGGPDAEDVPGEGDADFGPDAPDAPDTPADVPVEDAPADDAATAPTLVLSELDYQQPGLDRGDFVELYNHGSAPVACAGLALWLIAGGTATPTVYLPQELSCGSVPAGGFHLVAAADLHDAVPCASKQLLGTDQIQNGPGDAVALVDTRSGEPVTLDSMAYDGAVAGWGEGTPAPADPGRGDESLQRTPAGRDTGDNGADFTVRTPTPCAAPP